MQYLWGSSTKKGKNYCICADFCNRIQFSSNLPIKILILFQLNGGNNLHIFLLLTARFLKHSSICSISSISTIIPIKRKPNNHHKKKQVDQLKVYQVVNTTIGKVCLMNIKQPQLLINLALLQSPFCWENSVNCFG